MTRISDAATNNSLIKHMLRTEQRREEANFQVTSGKKSRDYAGIARESQRLVDLESIRDLNKRFISNNKTARLRLDAMTHSLEAVQSNIKNVRKFAQKFPSSGKLDPAETAHLQKLAFNALQNMEAFLNIEVDGQYLFSGSRTDEPPTNLGLTSLGAFQKKYDGAFNTYPTTRAAHLINLKVSEDTTKQNLDYITETNWLVFRQDDDGDATNTGRSSIEATSDLFSNYEVGSRINVTGTARNNGEYTIDGISSDGTKIFISTEPVTDEETPLGLTSETTTGVAQVDSIRLGGTFEAGDVFTINVNGNTLSHTVVAGNTDLNGVRTAIMTAINADPKLNGIVTASAGGANELVLTSDRPGVPITTTAFATNGGATDNSTTAVSTTTANDGNVAFILDDGTTITNAKTGDVAFNREAGTIAAANTDAFKSVSVGDVINVSGDNASNGTYVVTAIDDDSQTLTVTANTITTSNDTVIDADDTGRLIFDRATDSITADRPAFGDLRAGDSFTVAGTLENDGVYTIGSVSEDGKTITINSSKLTDEGTDSTSSFFEYDVGTQFTFDTAADTIVAQNIDGSVLTDAFKDLQPGDSFTVSGTPDNDGTYTVGSVSSDGSMIRLDNATPLAGMDATATDSNGAGITVPARNFSLHTGNEIVFDSTTDTISLRDVTSSAATEEIFSNLRVGQQINISGSASNDGTYTIASIAPDGSGFTVAEDITVDETFDPDSAGSRVAMRVFAAGGSVESSQSYYGGNDSTMTHRVDQNRTIQWDINASHPAFEKAIRAMGILAQGKFGSEGGLDQNIQRIKNAIYLLDDSITSPAEGTPPYGDEIQESMDEIFFDVGFKQVVLKDTNAGHENFNGLLNNFIAETENAPRLEAVSRLLDEQRSLQASYQALSRVFQMNLADFL